MADGVVIFAFRRPHLNYREVSIYLPEKIEFTEQEDSQLCSNHNLLQLNN